MTMPLSMFGTSAAAGGADGFQNLVQSNVGRLRKENAVWQAPTSDLMLLSVWVQAVDIDKQIYFVGAGVGSGSTTSRIRIYLNGSGASEGTLRITMGAGTSTDNIYNSNSTDTVDTTQLNHFLIARSGTTLQVYVNDAPFAMPGAPSTGSSAWGGFSTTSLCTNNQNSAVGTAKYGDIWWYGGQYLDLSVEANRRKFITADLQPVPLGATGELPLGATPDIFIGDEQEAADWNTGNNLGTIGNAGWTLSDGPFTDIPDTAATGAVQANGGRLRTTLSVWEVNAATDQFLMSAWVDVTGASGNVYIMGVGLNTVASNSRIRMTIQAGGAASNMLLQWGNASNIDILNSTLTNTFDGNGMINYLISRSGSTLQVYINDVANPAVLSPTTATQNFASMGTSSFCSLNDNSVVQNAQYGDIWFYPGQYLDLSVEANRRKFIGPSGERVPLGDNGELPIGTRPDMYMSAELQSAPQWNVGVNLGLIDVQYLLLDGPFTDVP